MKKILLALVVILGLTLAGGTALAAEQISSFDVAIDIAEDSTITVQESIVYDFGIAERHGIYRDIPYSYKRGGNNYKLRMDVESVVDENGKSLTYVASRSGGELSIKIGDADILITGEHTYVITYTVQRALNYFDDHHELFWNVTGDGWQVPIQAATAAITLPAPLTDQQRLQQCFTGSYGSTEENCTSVASDQTTITYTSDQVLSSYQGMSIVLGWPQGITVQPTTWQEVQWFLADNWVVAIPLLYIVGMIFMWYTRGRDPKGRGTVIPHYEAPDKLSAGLVGTVVDEKADLRDISASIIQLAVNGYLKIKQVEKKKLIGSGTDYQFIKLKEADGKLGEYEKEIYDGIFDVGETRMLSDLKNKFYTSLPKIKKAMYTAVVQKNYFPTDPDKVRKGYMVAAIVFIVVGWSIVVVSENVAGGIAVGIGGVVGIVLSRVMPRKTKQGAEVHEHIEGFKWFLSVTEKERLKFHNAPEKSPQQFEQFLPYAMALQVENEWAEQFKDLYHTPPEWYEGAPGNTFTALYLANSLGSMSTDFKSAAASRPNTAGSGGSGFSGGGFSGGGFGGGGGGSW